MTLRSGRGRCRAPRKSRALALLIVFLLTKTTPGASPGAAAAFAAPAMAADESAVRVEAHSGDMLAVGLIHGDRLSIRLSHVFDNSPVHDAVVAVVLRGTTYPTVAEADGSYVLTAKDLALPGEAAVEFRITEGRDHETLGGVLKVTATAVGKDDRGNGRQMWWWALNFGVCIAFLWLFSRRKKTARQ
jgi:hypothetical protein